MSTIYITSDLHFGHKKIYPIRGFSSIEDHNKAIIDNWNSIITKRDSTFILGDIAFGVDNIKLLNKLNGYKKVILGNHDSYNIKNYIDYCTQIFGAIKYKDCILTHIPVHESQFQRYKYNIHGHLHDTSLDDERYFCVSLERNGLYPFKLNDILTLLNK